MKRLDTVVTLTFEETVEYLAVDMGALGDGQTSDEYTVSICAKDSSVSLRTA